MDQLPFRDGYHGETIQQLIALKGQYRLDSLVIALDEAVQNSPHKPLTDAELAVVAVEALEMQVNNGGYTQFFTNTSVDFAAVIVSSLKLIGCLQTADITQRAVNMLGDVDLTDPDAIAAVVEATFDDEQWDALSQEFFTYPDPIAERLWEYVEAHPDQIRIPA
jgi:hypothetical protein